jgi:PadR family transcriptional regulator PadR
VSVNFLRERVKVLSRHGVGTASNRTKRIRYICKSTRNAVPAIAPELCRQSPQYRVDCLQRDMSKEPSPRLELLQGTLDLLVLRTLVFGPAHGHAIAQSIRRTSEDVLQVETGSLYPALHRLEAQGWLVAAWAISEKGKRAKYYRLSQTGRKRLVEEQSRWDQLSQAIGRVLRPAD